MSQRCAVMQPTFLPWAGYFRLMAAVNHFVYLDNVQLTRRSWQTRNRILNNGAIRWIGVPIAHAGQEQLICTTQIAEDTRWRGKLCRQLQQSYARHPFALELGVLLDEIEQLSIATLADLNIALIDSCAQQLNIATPRLRSSTLPLQQNDRTKRLIEICTSRGADIYVSPLGSADYLAEDCFCEQTNIRLEFAAYTPPPYTQYGAETFASHLSIIDIVANLGWEGAADYIRGPWHDLLPENTTPPNRQET